MVKKIIFFILGLSLLSWAKILSGSDLNLFERAIPYNFLVKDGKENRGTSSTAMVKRNLTVSSHISGISNHTSVDIKYRSGSAGIIIEGPESIIDKLSVVEKGVTLIITAKENKWGASQDFSKVKVTITLPVLLEVTLNGSGDFIAEKVTTDQFRTNILGSGDMRIKSLTASGVTFNLRGSGDVVLDKLSTNILSMFSQGSGDIIAKDVECVSLKNTIHGSGDLSIDHLITTQCNVIVQGSGDVRVKGITASFIKILSNGSGDVTVEGVTSAATVSLYGSGDVNCRNLKYDTLSQDSYGSGELYINRDMSK